MSLDLRYVFTCEGCGDYRDDMSGCEHGAICEGCFTEGRCHFCNREMRDGDCYD